MTDHGDRLREAFETHENLAPDPAAVYARVRELARTHRLRRRTAQVAGGAALGAGLIAGGITLPTLLPGATPPATVAVAVPPAAAAAPSSTPSPDQLKREWDAYFAAGYGYDDALTLAKIWHLPIKNGDTGPVKAEAGQRLLDGKKLPIKPTPPGNGGVTPKEDREVSAFFAAGYNYADAVTLAKLWKTADPYHAKIEGGKKLLAGETLPIRP